MEHEPPMDLVILNCKGYCGSQVAIPLERLILTMRRAGYKSVAEFSRAFRCSHCEAQVDWMIESSSVETTPSTPAS